MATTEKAMNLVGGLLPSSNKADLPISRAVDFVPGRKTPPPALGALNLRAT